VREVKRLLIGLLLGVSFCLMPALGYGELELSELFKERCPGVKKKVCV